MSNEYEHFNSPCLLPPVGSPLIVQLKGTFKRVGSDGFSLDMSCSEPLQVRAKRIAHIKSRDDEMAYLADDGSTYYGRFAWTHP